MTGMRKLDGKMSKTKTLPKKREKPATRNADSKTRIKNFLRENLLKTEAIIS
jgi:hypothetical protein